MINPSQYANLILEPSLKAMKMYSLDAMYLMMRTALVESRLTHIKQLPAGPALGFMQIEPATYADIVRYLNGREGIRELILEYCGYSLLPSRPDPLIHNLAFNAMIARVKYWMVPAPIPNYKDIQGQGEYYLEIFATYGSKSTVDDFLKQANNLGLILGEG
jgi:hypothetical protein